MIKCSAVIGFLVFRSLQNFAQNFVVITMLLLQWKQNELPWNFNFEGKSEVKCPPCRTMLVIYWCYSNTLVNIPFTDSIMISLTVVWGLCLQELRTRSQGWGQIRICICKYKYKYKYGVFVFVFVFDQISSHVFVFVFVFDPPYLVYLTNTFSNTLFSWAVF